MRKWSLLPALVILLAASCCPAAAETIAIASGQTVNGNIWDAGWMDTYTFWGDGGDHATILMGKSSGSLWPCIELQAPDGTVLGTTYGNPSATLDSIALPQPGTYYIICRDHLGSYTGEYGVSLIKNPGTTSPPDVDGGPIASGETKQGAIDVGDLDAFTFVASAGDHATILMGKSSGSLWPCIELQAPDGTVLGTTYGNPSATLDSIALPQLGTYYVICRDHLGYYTGTYGVSLALVLSNPPSPPVADFSATPTSGAAPLPVQFTDTSTGNPTAWLWTFGDGATSAEQDPSHTYIVADSYTVSLTVWNAGGADTEAKSDYIVLLPPTADFSATPTTGTVSLAVAFTDASTGAPTGWLWSFGDGTTSTEQHPSHSYDSPGLFTVSLTATNAGGTDTETKVNYILVYPALPDPPVASFTATPTAGLAPLLVAFSDTSTGDPNGWLWSLGDGMSSTQQNPSHQYTSPGRYTVSLAASTPGGSSIATRPTYITVSFPDVALDFWAVYQILACVDAGIVSGYPDGTYRPELPVDRAAMAVFIARGMSDPAERPYLPSYTPPATPTFPDVPTGHWAYKYIEYAHAQNVVGGYWDGTYRPDLIVNRDAMAVFVSRGMVAPAGDAGVPEDPDGTPFFPDVPDTHWAYKYIEYCHDRGVVGGYWDGTYRPEEVVNRGAMAVYVQRAFALPM